MTVHPTAIIDPSAKLGKNVTIEPYAVIGPEVRLGDRCHIRSFSILEYAELGNDCAVFPHATIGLAPQHLGYKGEPTKVIIGDRCTFREGVTVHRGTLFDKGVTFIGNDGYFMAGAHIAHDCHIGNNVILANDALLAGHVHVADRVFMSALAAAHQFVRIGEYAMISGASMIPMDVAPYCTVQGDRATLKGLNLVGMRRGGIGRSQIKLIKEAIKKVFYSNITLAEALADPMFLSTDIHIKNIKDFLSTPKRGFVRPTEKQITESNIEEASE